jgi:NAD(P)-dependent dehydrogenase (short-subunit alcohol dehydrogenase family)
MAPEGFTETLAEEVRRFGIDVTLIEPGGYATDRSASSALHSEPLPAYQPFRDTLSAQRAAAVPAATCSRRRQLGPTV